MTDVQQLGWSFRAWWAGPGRTAFRHVYPSYVLLLLVVLVVFGGNGLQPRTVVEFAWTTPWGGILLLFFWVGMSSRAYRAALNDPGFMLLRTFPLSAVALATVGSTFVLVVESPWLMLWATGGGALQAVAALFGSLLCSYLWNGTNRMRARFLPPVVIRLRPLIAVTAFLRTLGRRHTQGVVLGIGSWGAVTALATAMFRREHETLATRLDFAITLFALCVVGLSTTSLWLLLQEERKVKWVFLSTTGGSGLMVCALAGAALVVGVGLGVFGCCVTLLLAPRDVAHDVTVVAPLIFHVVSYGTGLGLLGAGASWWWSTDHRRSRAPMAGLLVAVPLVLLSASSASLGGWLTFAGGVGGFLLLRSVATGLSDGAGNA